MPCRIINKLIHLVKFSISSYTLVQEVVGMWSLIRKIFDDGVAWEKSTNQKLEQSGVIVYAIGPAAD